MSMTSPEQPGREPAEGDGPDTAELLSLVARGDQGAFEAVYDRLSGPVYGLVRRVLRDPSQSEEGAQEGLQEAEVHHEL